MFGCDLRTGGESGIRTHVTLSSKHAFQACAFSHSAISPARIGGRNDLKKPATHSNSEHHTVAFHFNSMGGVGQTATAKEKRGKKREAQEKVRTALPDRRRQSR